jgi:hypothetical protein
VKQRWRPMSRKLSHSVRKRLMPIFEDMTMEERVRAVNALLRTRTRDVEDTVAQLVKGPPAASYTRQR